MYDPQNPHQQPQYPPQPPGLPPEQMPPPAQMPFAAPQPHHGYYGVTGQSIEDPEAGGTAVATLVLGLLAIVIGVTAPVAWIVGHIGRKNCVKRGFKPPAMMTVGWILGIVFTILLTLQLIFFFVIILPWMNDPSFFFNQLDQ